MDQKLILYIQMDKVIDFFLQLFNQSIFVQKEKVVLNSKQQNIPAIFIEPK